MAKENKIKDIFKNGEYLTIWQDGDFIYVAFPSVIITMSKEEWNYFKRDIDKLAEL